MPVEGEGGAADRGDPRGAAGEVGLGPGGLRIAVDAGLGGLGRGVAAVPRGEVDADALGGGLLEQQVPGGYEGGGEVPGTGVDDLGPGVGDDVRPAAVDDVRLGVHQVVVEAGVRTDVEDVRVRGEAVGEVDVESLFARPGTRGRARVVDVPVAGSDVPAVLARPEGVIAGGPGVAVGVGEHVG